MASKRKISTVVAFEGEQQYKQTIDDITKEHRKLKSELELVTAEFKATGDAEKMFTEKSKLLNKQIEGQNKAIKTAEEALKKLKENGVDKTSAAWTHWEKELTSAKTSMFKAQAELNKINEAYEKAEEAAIEAADATEKVTDATEQVTQATERATQETADYSETLKSIDKGVKFGNILNGLRVVKDAVGGVISTAYRMGKALVMSQISGGDWAREIMVGAAEADVSVEEYQARLYAQAVSGIDANSITEGIKKTAENLATTDAELLKVYNDLGISTRNADDSVRDMTETFWESVDALKSIEDQTTRAIYAQALLGDQYIKLRGLVDLGSEGYEKLIEEGKASATVTEESVNALADMDAAYEKTSATAQSLMHDINAELAPGFTEMAGAFTEVLQEFDDFLKSEDGQRVFNNWNETLAGIADTIKETDFTAAFEVISGALNGIVAAFEAAFKTALAVKDIIEWFSTNEDLKRFLGIAPAETTPPTISAEEAQKLVEGTYVVQVGNAAGQSSAAQSKDLQKYAEELRNIHSGIISAYLKNDYESIYKDVLGILENENYKPFLKDYNIRQGLGSFLDIYESGNAMTDGYLIYGAMKNLMAHVDSIMSQTAEIAETGGGGAMNAFNAAIEKGTQDTQKTLKTGVAAAFSGMDSFFASMGAAHGSAYINALSAQISRINSMLSLSPSYAYGGTYYNPAQGAYASPTSTANVSLYVGREKFGDVTTPIVDARMGAAIETAR